MCVRCVAESAPYLGVALGVLRWQVTAPRRRDRVVRRRGVTVVEGTAPGGTPATPRSSASDTS